MSCFDQKSLREVGLETNKITAALHHVATIKKIDDMIPSLCCGYHEVISQATRLIDRMCIKKTGVKTSQYFIGIIQSAMSDSIDMICGAYGSIGVCEQKIPEVLKEVRAIINENRVYNHTAVIPLLDLVARIDSGIE